LGERSKWVRVSAQRISYIDVSPSAVTVLLSGEAQEMVAMDFAVQSSGGISAVKTQTCTLGQDGLTSLIITSDGTASCAITGLQVKQARRSQEMAME